MTTRSRGIFLALIGWAAAEVQPGAAAEKSPRPDNSLLADGPPFVRDWVPAVYPPEARREKIGGRAVVRAVVDETGRVTTARVLTAPDPRLGEAALTAVKTWVFTPATEDMKHIAMCMDVPFEFDPDKPEPKKPGLLPPAHLLPQPSPRTAAASVKAAALSNCPETLHARLLTGRVIYECEVTPEGRAEGFRVLGATHADLVLPALLDGARWEFSPAIQGDLPIRAKLRGEISHDMELVSRSRVLAANGITAPDGGVPEDWPLPEVTADPVWPYEPLLAGESGSARVEFTVLANGLVTGVKVREATAPEFGRALVAALETWTFQPAIKDGRSVKVVLLKRAEFKHPSAAAGGASDPHSRLVPLAKAGRIGSRTDEKLTPVYRVAPAVPEAVAESAERSGEAVIEFVIDRDGRARLPRIVSATREEYGWAAATAITQWVFRAPRLDGAPTEVKVAIPFKF